MRQQVREFASPADPEAVAPAVGALVVHVCPGARPMRVIDHGRETGLVICGWRTDEGDLRHGAFAADSLRAIAADEMMNLSRSGWW